MLPDLSTNRLPLYRAVHKKKEVASGTKAFVASSSNNLLAKTRWHNNPKAVATLSRLPSRSAVTFLGQKEDKRRIQLLLSSSSECRGLFNGQALRKLLTTHRLRDGYKCSQFNNEIRYPIVLYSINAHLKSCDLSAQLSVFSTGSDPVWLSPSFSHSSPLSNKINNFCPNCSSNAQAGEEIIISKEGKHG